MPEKLNGSVGRSTREPLRHLPEKGSRDPAENNGSIVDNRAYSLTRPRPVMSKYRKSRPREQIRQVRERRHRPGP